MRKFCNIVIKFCDAMRELQYLTAATSDKVNIDIAINSVEDKLQPSVRLSV